jgi:hypothetical protein
MSGQVLLEEIVDVIGEIDVLDELVKSTGTAAAKERGKIEASTCVDCELKLKSLVAILQKVSWTSCESRSRQGSREEIIYT